MHHYTLIFLMLFCVKTACIGGELKILLTVDNNQIRVFECVSIRIEVRNEGSGLYESDLPLNFVDGTLKLIVWNKSANSGERILNLNMLGDKIRVSPKTILKAGEVKELVEVVLLDAETGLHVFSTAGDYVMKVKHIEFNSKTRRWDRAIYSNEVDIRVDNVQETESQQLWLAKGLGRNLQAGVLTRENVNILESIIRQYPDSPYALQAAFFLGKYGSKVSPELLVNYYDYVIKRWPNSMYAKHADISRAIIQSQVDRKFDPRNNFERTHEKWDKQGYDVRGWMRSGSRESVEFKKKLGDKEFEWVDSGSTEEGEKKMLQWVEQELDILIPKHTKKYSRDEWKLMQKKHLEDEKRETDERTEKSRIKTADPIKEKILQDLEAQAIREGRNHQWLKEELMKLSTNSTDSNVRKKAAELIQQYYSK